MKFKVKDPVYNRVSIEATEFSPCWLKSCHTQSNFFETQGFFFPCTVGAAYEPSTFFKSSHFHCKTISCSTFFLQQYHCTYRTWEQFRQTTNKTQRKGTAWSLVKCWVRILRKVSMPHWPKPLPSACTGPIFGCYHNSSQLTVSI